MFLLHCCILFKKYFLIITSSVPLSHVYIHNIGSPFLIGMAGQCHTIYSIDSGAILVILDVSVVKEDHCRILKHIVTIRFPMYN